MEEDKDCDYDHTMIDDYGAWGRHKENCSVGGGISNTCKDVVTKTRLMQLQFENGLHEDVELQSELPHA